MYAIYVYSETTYTLYWYTKSLFAANHIATNIARTGAVKHVDIVDYHTGEVLKIYTK